MNLNEFIAALEKLRDEGRGDYLVMMLNMHYEPWMVEVIEEQITVRDEYKEVRLEPN